MAMGTKMVMAAALPRKRRRFMAAVLPRRGRRTMAAAQGRQLAQQTLPDDLIVEILSWMPVKDLIRFRRVSKTWNSLISNPTFVKLHLQRSSKNTHILLRWLEDISVLGAHASAAPCSIRRFLENPSSTVDDCCHEFYHNYSVFGACNGLVCLHDSFGDGSVLEEHWVQFWNPATGIMTRDSPRLRCSSSDSKIGLLGFGFDDWSNTYKVVIFLSGNRSQNWDAMVHCLGDTCWRNVLTCPTFSALGDNDGQFVSGTLNWVALRSPGSHFKLRTATIDQLIIFSFDLKNETYRYLSMPDGLLEVPSLEPCLGVLKGCLCLSHNHRRTHLVVWLMREFGVEKSWTQLLNVSYEHLHILPTRVMPLCMSENEHVLLLNRDSKLVFYNRRDNRVDRTEVFNDKIYLFSYDYVESLVLPY